MKKRLRCGAENPYDATTPKRTCERDWDHTGPHWHPTNTPSLHGWPRTEGVPSVKYKVAEEVLRRYPHYKRLFSRPVELEVLVADVMSVVEEVEGCR